jgi:hypothetical protein
VHLVSRRQHGDPPCEVAAAASRSASVGLVCALLAAGPAGAARLPERGTWRPPVATPTASATKLRFAGDALTPGRFAIDSRGTAAVIYVRGRSVRLVTLAFGARRTLERRLRVPHDALDVYSLDWDMNPSGQFAAAFANGPTGPRDGRLSVVGGHIRGRTGAPQTVSLPGRSEEHAHVDVSAHGTALVHWKEEYGGSGEPQALDYWDQVAFASGPSDGRIVRRRPFARTVYARGDVAFGVVGTFIRSERVVWTWLTTEQYGADEEGLWIDRRWTGMSARRGTRPPRPRIVAKEDGPSARFTTLQFDRVLTDGSGGQVTGMAELNAFVTSERAPAEPFGRRTRLPATSSGLDVSGAINPAGDAVFAWGGGHGPLWALLRRRDGRLVGPRLVTEDRASQPHVAIDRRGRSVVVWQRHDPRFQSTGFGDVRAAVSDRGGNFGAARTVSDRPATILFPAVAMNDAGQVAVKWVAEDAGGRPGARIMIAHGRL